MTGRPATKNAQCVADRCTCQGEDRPRQTPRHRSLVFHGRPSHSSVGTCGTCIGSIYIHIKKGRRNDGQPLADGTHPSGGFLGHLAGGLCRVCPGRLGALHVCERHHHHSRHERLGRPCCTQLGFVAFAPGLHLSAGTRGMLHLVECCLCAWDMLHLVE